MGAQQLVVSTSDRSLVSVPNERHEDPTVFEVPGEGRMVPRLGSSSLLRLAAYASQLGYIVVGVEIRDRAFQFLEPDLSESISEALVTVLRDNNLPAARALLNGDRGPYSVVAIDVVDEEDHDIRVARLGEVEADDGAAVTNLVTRAWVELQLT